MTDARPEADRVQWSLLPLVGVGPLRFGMTPDDAVLALDGFTSELLPRRVIEFEQAGHPALTAYFDDSALRCVVVDAQWGPQVTWEGLRMVGRTPADWVADIFGVLPPRGIPVNYEPGGNPGADALGLVMRIQRVGDSALTRPALLGTDRAAWDALPSEERTLRGSPRSSG